MEIIPSQHLSVYTDRKYPSAIRSVYTDEISSLVYTNRITDRLYSFLECCNGVMTWIFFQTLIQTEWPRDSNLDLRIVTWHIHRWNHRRVYRWKVSVGDSIGKSQYIPSADTLFLYFSFFFPIPPLPSQTAANHPSQLSPSSQHKHSSFLYFRTWSQHLFLWILSFFVSKSILFSFNI